MYYVRVCTYSVRRKLNAFDVARLSKHVDVYLKT